MTLFSCLFPLPFSCSSFLIFPLSVCWLLLALSLILVGPYPLGYPSKNLPKLYSKPYLAFLSAFAVFVAKGIHVKKKIDCWFDWLVTRFVLKCMHGPHRPRRFDGLVEAFIAPLATNSKDCICPSGQWHPVANLLRFMSNDRLNPLFSNRAGLKSFPELLSCRFYNSRGDEGTTMTHETYKQARVESLHRRAAWLKLQNIDASGMTWNESLGSRLRGALGHKVDVSSASCGTNGVMHLLFFVKTHDTFTPIFLLQTSMLKSRIPSHIFLVLFTLFFEVGGGQASDRMVLLNVATRRKIVVVKAAELVIKMSDEKCDSAWTSASAGVTASFFFFPTQDQELQLPLTPSLTGRILRSLGSYSGSKTCPREAYLDVWDPTISIINDPNSWTWADKENTTLFNLLDRAHWKHSLKAYSCSIHAWIRMMTCLFEPKSKLTESFPEFSLVHIWLHNFRCLCLHLGREIMIQHSGFRLGRRRRVMAIAVCKQSAWYGHLILVTRNFGQYGRTPQSEEKAGSAPMCLPQPPCYNTLVLVVCTLPNSQPDLRLPGKKQANKKKRTVRRSSSFFLLFSIIVSNNITYSPSSGTLPGSLLSFCKEPVLLLELLPAHGPVNGGCGSMHLAWGELFLTDRLSAGEHTADRLPIRLLDLKSASAQWHPFPHQQWGFCCTHCPMRVAGILADPTPVKRLAGNRRYLYHQRLSRNIVTKYFSSLKQWWKQPILSVPLLSRYSYLFRFPAQHSPLLKYKLLSLKFNMVCICYPLISEFKKPFFLIPTSLLSYSHCSYSWLVLHFFFSEKFDISLYYCYPLIILLSSCPP
ncbi:hypothetical protein VP01_1142g1 [Puccinia sorghi]|uniref:Uncharacterized protein n=1 Tax=Puccinia sorghi TaxID=27349 RepID=A0A0L6VRV9_9BASI|nr:hypothetical protein VP01_1142g1 [Puccinia sorghi]